MEVRCILHYLQHVWNCKLIIQYISKWSDSGWQATGWWELWFGRKKWLGMEAELFVFSFGEWIGYFRFICRPRLHLIAHDPGTHLNQAERLTAKRSWIVFALHYLIADCEGKWEHSGSFWKRSHYLSECFLARCHIGIRCSSSLPTRLISVEAKEMYLFQFQSLACC